MMIKIVKRHLFLWLTCCGVLAMCGVLGYKLSIASESLNQIQPPSANDPVIVMMRFTLYAVLVWGWLRLLQLRLRDNAGLIRESAQTTPTLFHSRVGPLVAVLVYELVIVQKWLTHVLRALL